jgi:hypothetical protein
VEGLGKSKKNYNYGFKTNILKFDEQYGMRTVCSFYGLPAALILRLICLKNKQKV